MRQFLLGLGAGIAAAAGLAIWMMRPRPEDLEGWSAHGASEVVYRSPAAEIPVAQHGTFPNICGMLHPLAQHGYCTLLPGHEGQHDNGGGDLFSVAPQGRIQETLSTYHPLHP